MAHRRLRAAVRSRGFLLLPAAAFAVHQLRYTLAYGSHASQALSAQGHSYLNSLAPWLVLLVAFGAASFLLRVAAALAGRQNARPARSFVELWAIAAGALVAIYVLQEVLEGAFASGHPTGAGGVVGHGGWLAFPLAVAFGAAVAALLRVGYAIVAVAARAVARRPVALRQISLPRWSFVLLPRSPLAAAAAGRAPPAA